MLLSVLVKECLATYPVAATALEKQGILHAYEHGDAAESDELVTDVHLAAFPVISLNEAFWQFNERYSDAA